MNTTLLKIKSMNIELDDLYKNHSTFHDGACGIDLFIPEDITIKMGETKSIDLNIKCAFSIVEGQGVTFYELAKEFGFPIITLEKLTYEEEIQLIKKIILIFKDSVKNESQDYEFYNEFIKDFEVVEEKFIEKIINIIESDEIDNSVRRLVRLTVKGLTIFKQYDGKRKNLEELLMLE